MLVVIDQVRVGVLDVVWTSCHVRVQACSAKAMVGAMLGLSTAGRNLSRYYCKSLMSGIGNFNRYRLI